MDLASESTGHLSRLAIVLPFLADEMGAVHPSIEMQRTYCPGGILRTQRILGMIQKHKALRDDLLCSNRIFFGR